MFFQIFFFVKFNKLFLLFLNYKIMLKVLITFTKTLLRIILKESSFFAAIESLYDRKLWIKLLSACTRFVITQPLVISELPLFQNINLHFILNHNVYHEIRLNYYSQIDIALQFTILRKPLAIHINVEKIFYLGLKNVQLIVLSYNRSSSYHQVLF